MCCHVPHRVRWFRHHGAFAARRTVAYIRPVTVGRRRTWWALSAVVVVVVGAVVVAVVVFRGGSNNAATTSLTPITNPAQGLLQAADFPDGYRLEPAGTETGPVTLSNLSPPACARAATAENNANTNRFGQVQFAEPPRAALPRYQQTVQRDGASLDLVRRSAQACPRSVEASGSVSVTVENTLLTPSECPAGAVVVQTRSTITVARTATRDYITAWVQNGRFVTRLVQEWTAPATSDVAQLCHLATAAQQRLSS